MREGRRAADTSAGAVVIGRFSRGLGDRPLAPLAAGLILLVIGGWNSAELLLPSYPGNSDLESFQGEAFDAIVVVRQRGALVRLFHGRSLELQAVLEPDTRLVLYRDDMPAYEAVRDVVTAGPAVYGLWPDAPDDDDRHRIWSLTAPDGTIVVDRATTVATLQATRREAALMPGVIAVVGLFLTAYALRLWRRRQRLIDASD